MPKLSPKAVLSCLLLFVSLVIVSIAITPSCTWRACRNNIVCIVREIGEPVPDAGFTPMQVFGYKCDTKALLCAGSCTKANEANDCDTENGYKCETLPNETVGKCRCDIQDLKKPCHRQCFLNDECFSRLNPNTKESLFPKASGFTCKANEKSADLPGTCECTGDTPQCAALRAEGTPQEATPEEESGGSDAGQE